MLRRTLSTAAAVLLAAAPLAAQKAGMHHDPDHAMKGGALPTGWMGRTDNAKSKLEDAKFVTMGTGFHVTSGPAAIYWNEKNKAMVPFTATATFTQTKAPSHPEAYGLFFAGDKLQGADQTYLYLIVRGDGKVMVKHRAGTVVHTIMDWTENAAVHKQDASGKATNTLSVVALPALTHLLVNGVQVAVVDGTYGPANGYVGVRVNHNLDVHIDQFTVTPGAKSSK